MDSDRTDKVDLSKVMGLETKDIHIDNISDTDELDDMEMVPFSTITLQIEPVETYSVTNNPMENTSIYDGIEMDYSSVYMYDYPGSTEIETDYNMYNFDDVELSQMFEPWYTNPDIIVRNEETNCNNNLENINDYNFVNTDNSIPSNDYASPRFPSDINEILRNIETFNQGIIRNLMVYSIPYDIARRIVRSIISLTLDYYR